MDTFTTGWPDDFHVHFRQERFLRMMAQLMAGQFGRALAMSNTKPPIGDANDVYHYEREIKAEVGDQLDLIMTLKLLDRTTPRIIEEARTAGVRAIKGFPRGGTSHAEDGMLYYEILRYYPVFEAAEDQDMIMLWHGEVSGDDDYVLDREYLFLQILRQVARDFPRLKMVMEHITTAAAVRTVLSLPDTVAATITLHHMELTTNDVLAGKLRPHNFCMPVAKRFEDRLALRSAATSRNRKFFFGSDTAVWAIDDKQAVEGCAGVFSAVGMVPRLVQIFEGMGALDKLPDFMSRFGAEFYGLPPNEGTLTVIRENWEVPLEYHGARPYLAGKTLPWKVLS